MKLTIVSHVRHHLWQGGIHAYTPYAREIEVWADLFERVTIAAPCRRAAPRGDQSAIDRPRVSMAPQRETGGPTPAAKAAQLAQLPLLAASLFGAMRTGDAVHVRCPGNLGLLGVLLAPLTRRHLVAKYAGQWCPYPGEAWSYRLQRRLLRSPWFRGPVTVYGEWPGQPPKVVPFFTSVLERRHLERARAAAAGRRPGQTLEVLFVGRLSRAKNVDALLAAMATLAAGGVDARATIVGDGPERPALEAQAARLALGSRARFTGGLAFEQVLDAYRRADVLVLISETEGWPKAITEAMAFGCVCIGSRRGLVPTILGDGRGLVVPAGDAAALARQLTAVARAPQRFEAMRRAAADWGQRYTLDHLRQALGDLLAARWRLPREAFADRAEGAP